MKNAPKEDEQEKSQINPPGRLARCANCGRVTTSKEDLPWFKSKPDELYDDYYCGCRGWD